MRKVKKNNGITLIALVITIIVLLILAGVSIATLTGQNGLLTKTSTAKVETAKKSAEEKVKVAVAGSLGTDGRINLGELNTNLRQVEGLTNIFFKGVSIWDADQITELPIEVLVDGYTFEIDVNGKLILKGEKSQVTLAKPVVNYTLSTTEAVAEGTTVTVTITATITEGTIVKITKPNGDIENNKATTTFYVTTNGYYTVVVEGSNGEKTTEKIKITNIGNSEIFSDIYAETKTYTDKNGRIAKIPQGFAVGESNTINTIENGLVITDEIDENHKSIGNEFVWVPVDNTADFKRVDGYLNGAKQTLVSNGTCTEPYTNVTQEERDLYTAMYNSVTNEKNKGFYIGRYESGKENNKVVVKKNKPVYNNIGWSNVNNMTTLTGGAVELSKNFVKTTYSDNGKTVGVTSTLIYGVQWDAALKFFNNEGYLKNSTGKGWYNTTLHNTGIDVDANASNRVKNIYDMAGNVWEWTMEAYGTTNRMYRGGRCNNAGSDYPSSSRSNYYPDYSYDYIGFRLALYL